VVWSKPIPPSCFSPLRGSLVSQLRHHVGARDPDEVACLLDPRGRDAQVVVIGERLVDQLLERLVLEDIPPWQIGKRLGADRRFLAAVCRWCLDVQTLVVWADGTGGERQGAHSEERPRYIRPELRRTIANLRGPSVLSLL